MENLINLYKKQLLWQNSFLQKYAQQLKSLYYNEAFMAYIQSIRNSFDFPEDAAHIEDSKAIAKRSMYETSAARTYPALGDIAADVAAKGCAKNSAYISVYLAMRIFEMGEEISETVPATPNDTSAAPASSPNEYDFRLKWPAEYRCEDGHYVRSKNEMLVDNWLYSKGICHAYEKALFSRDGKRSYCSDFYIPDQKLFIEIWGMNDPKYQAYRKQKTEFYHKHGFDLLEIKGDEVKNLDDKLNAAFCAR